MKSLARDTEVATYIEASMPDASPEEKLQASFEFWQFFDAIWAIADRLVSERENASRARDNPVPFATLEMPPNT